MTVRQKSWIKYLCKIVALFGGVMIFARLGFEGYSFGLAAVCVALVQVFVWGNIWGGQELAPQQVKQQYVHLAIGVVVIGLLISLVVQFGVVEPRLRSQSH